MSSPDSCAAQNQDHARVCCWLAGVCQDFLAAKGSTTADGAREDPPLSAFEEQIQKYK
jgi:hypothetical protein